MRVEIWSDLVCPWCYVGKRRFERALASFPNGGAVDIVHRAYLLYSSLPRGTRVDRREMLMSKYRVTQDQADGMNANMIRVAAAEGLDYHLSGGVTGNTFDAHQLVLLARDRGRENEVLEHLYRAFFVEQRSIFERDALTALGVEAGLDHDEVAQALDRDAYAAAVTSDIEEARKIRVSGVPFFVFDRYAIAGAQAVEVFTETLSRVSTGQPGRTGTA